MPSTAATSGYGPRVLTLTLTEGGYKNLDIISDDGKVLYSIRTSKPSSLSQAYSPSRPASSSSPSPSAPFHSITTLSRSPRLSSNSNKEGGPVAVFSWRKKEKGDSVILYKGKESELDEWMPVKEWHSRKVSTLSGTWHWSMQGEEPPELSDASSRPVVKHVRHTRLFRKSLPTTLEIDQVAIDCLGLDMIVAGWVVMMREMDGGIPIFD